MKRIIWVALVTLSLTSAQWSEAQTYRYVRSEATGAATGLDWTNAYRDLPNALERSVTYLIADGTYGSRKFNTPNDGSKVITVRKATPAAHGTQTGWNDSYGDGVAQWNGSLYFSTDYYLIDGATGGGPGSWEQGFGFAFDFTGWHLVHLEGPRHDITFRHCDLESGGRGSTYTEDQIFYAIGGPYNLVLSYCWLHDVRGCQLLTRSGHDYLIEYSKFSRNGGGGAASHREAWSGSNECNVVLRHCFFEDISNTAFIGLVNGFGEAANWSIHGNLFVHSGNLVEPDNQISPAVILTKYAPGVTEIVPKNWRIMNNTFANIAGNTGFRFVQVASPGDVMVRNNLFWRGSGGAIHMTAPLDMDHNWYGDNQTPAGEDLDAKAASAEVHSTAGSGDPFRDYRAKDWRLKAPLVAGSLLSTPFDVDAYGNRRGQDGFWDVGAYEFTQAALNAPTATRTPLPPTATRTPSATASRTATATVTATETPLVIDTKGAKQIIIRRVY